MPRLKGFRRMFGQALVVVVRADILIEGVVMGWRLPDISL